MNGLKRSLAIALVLAASTFGILAVGSPASAALPFCNNVSGVADTSSGSTRYQTYVSGGSYTVACNMNWLNENGNDGQRRAIRQLQWDLVGCYGQSISVDGEYGPQTKQAVKNVQSYLNTSAGGSWGLAVDGWAGPNTRKAMVHINVEWTFCSRALLVNGNPQIQYVWGYEWLDVPYA